MLNYEEELRKFKPSLEVDQIEEAVYKEDLTDMQDIVKEVMAKKEKTETVNDQLCDLDSQKFII